MIKRIIGLVLAITLASAGLAQTSAVSKSTATATKDQIVGDLKFGSGSALQINGPLSGTPTSGALNLINLTLTLPNSLTLTGKTLTGGTFSAPAISAPTGLTKSDVGLGNVDNTSDATKNAATATLTNKTMLNALLSGYARVTGTDDATDATGTTGSLGTLGGVSVKKNLKVGEGGFFGSSVGIGASLDNALMLRIQNTSTGTGASSGILLTSDTLSLSTIMSWGKNHYGYYDSEIPKSLWFDNHTLFSFSENAPLMVHNSTDAETVGTGSLRTLGGLSVAKSIYLGGSLSIGGVTLTTLKGPNAAGSNIWLGGGGIVSYATSSGVSYEGSYNTSVGRQSAVGLTTGALNSLFGYSAGSSIISGGANCAFGSHSLYNNQTGASNFAGGLRALYSNSSGSGSVAIGAWAGAYATDGNEFFVNNQNRTNLDGDKTKSLLYGTFAVDPANQTLKINARLGISVVAEYADNTAAAAVLPVDTLYRTGDVVKIVH
jgi:hypothetical protein